VAEARPPGDDGFDTTHRTKEPAMALSHLPSSVANAFLDLARTFAKSILPG